MGDACHLVASDPDYWIVAFRPTTDSWLVSLLAFGRFKHVAALAYLPAAREWVTYDVGVDGTKITVIPEYQAPDIIGKWLQGCVLVAIKRKSRPLRTFPFLGWCAPAIARLLGLHGALRPDALYRQCLRNGGSVIEWAATQKTLASASSPAA